MTASLATRPDLYLFAISHYCEKARWALDYFGIEYRLRYLAPGSHVKVAKKLGAPLTSLPYLVIDGEVVHGSANVVSWAEAHARQHTEGLTPDDLREECLGIEQRLDEIAGVHVRRFYYAEAMVDYPDTVRPIFTHDLPLLQKALITLGWSRIREAMIRLMDLGPEQRLDSRGIVAIELDWLDSLLADGRAFLAGDRFTRADLTAASLLAPMANPPEHPVYAGLQMPPLYSEDVARWANRPILEHVRRIYREYR